MRYREAIKHRVAVVAHEVGSWTKAERRRLLDVVRRLEKTTGMTLRNRRRLVFGRKRQGQGQGQGNGEDQA